MENIAYIGYEHKIQFDLDLLIIAAWNKYAGYAGRDRIYLNNVEVFKKSFKNPYDAAWAVSSGDWRWTDDYVFFNKEGYITSFSHCDDERSPIDLDRIDIAGLVRALQDLQNDKRYVVNNIPKAIHDALKEV